MRNLLSLHEAIAVVLLSKPDRKATTDQIAAEINRRNLFQRKDVKPLPEYQVMMRCKLSNGKYKHLFKFIEPKTVILRNHE